MQLIIISGKIGSGKSTLSEFFKEKGFGYINSDNLAKEVISKNQSITKQLKIKFSNLNKFNTISSNHLKDILLTSIESKNIINKIIHPVFFKELNESIKDLKKDTIIELPLIETIKDIIFKYKVISVDTKLFLRKQRYLNKTGNNDKVFMRLNSYQKSNNFYKINSDYVISNNDNIESLYERFNKLYSELNE